MDLREEITLLPDPVWTDRYETERERIVAASDEDLLGVFHVGSTAIPDVPGKPALDVIAVYEGYEPMRDAAEELVDQGFELHHDESDSMLVVDWRDHHAVFVKMHTRDDEKVRNQILFRDYLRENAAPRREYERVKREAAEDYPEDVEAYTEAKSVVVSSIIERAHEEGYADRLPAFA